MVLHMLPQRALPPTAEEVGFVQRAVDRKSLALEQRRWRETLREKRASRMHRRHPRLWHYSCCYFHIFTDCGSSNEMLRASADVYILHSTYVQYTKSRRYIFF